MSNIGRLFKAFNDVQIYSALLWATAILLCGYFRDSDFLSVTIITLAGFHVVLLSHFRKTKSPKQT